MLKTPGICAYCPCASPCIITHPLPVAIEQPVNCFTIMSKTWPNTHAAIPVIESRPVHSQFRFGTQSGSAREVDIRMANAGSAVQLRVSSLWVDSRLCHLFIAYCITRSRALTSVVLVFLHDVLRLQLIVT